MHPTAQLTSLAIAAIVLPASAQQLVRSVNGPAANAQYGKACIVVPDQNGDGFKDVLVGAPGFNSQRGEILCLSGAFLASGVGTQTLWSFAPTANPGDLFGYAIGDVGDVTGDGVHDFLVGQPGYDISNANDIGAVRLVNGATHAVVSLITGPEASSRFGSAVAGCGDADGDGRGEAAVGAPGPNSNASYLFMLRGALLATTSAALAAELWHASGSGSMEIGASVAGGFDVDGVNGPDFVFGVPAHASFPGGAVFLCRVASGLQSSVVYSSPFPGERLGASVDAAHDYDGDGMIDIVVGAPNSVDAFGGKSGRVVVLSGARVLHQTAPYELYTFTSSVVGFDYHFGAAVRASDDLNGDGVGDILVGAPDYFTFSGTSFNSKGFASIFSGATGTRWATIGGATNDHFGSAIAGAIADLDGDGFKEFVLAGALSDAGGTDSGVVKCYRLFPTAPATYCTGKINSLGCTPAISFSGSPSANSSLPFLITASNFVNQKTGLLFYSHAPTANVFQGGTLCVRNPTVRAPPQNSGGSASGADCTGTYSFDFNNWITNGFDFGLAAGAEIYAQYWSRDPASASHTSLSNAVRFVINP